MLNSIPNRTEKTHRTDRFIDKVEVLGKPLLTLMQSLAPSWS